MVLPRIQACWRRRSGEGQQSCGPGHDIEVIGIRLARAPGQSGVEAFRRRMFKGEGRGSRDAEMMALAPMARASVSTAGEGKAGERRNRRRAQRKSNERSSSGRARSTEATRSWWTWGRRSEECIAGGFGSRHGGGEVVVDAHVDVGSEFQVYLAVDLLPRERIAMR